MKNLVFLILSFFWLSVMQNISAQAWMQTPPGEKPNFYKIQKAFNDYWIDKPVEKGQGYKQFKRWVLGTQSTSKWRISIIFCHMGCLAGIRQKPSGSSPDIEVGP
jgi:hypothetical protein